MVFVQKKNGIPYSQLGVKMVQSFFHRIRDRIHLDRIHTVPSPDIFNFESKSE